MKNVFDYIFYGQKAYSFQTNFAQLLTVTLLLLSFLIKIAIHRNNIPY